MRLAMSSEKTLETAQRESCLTHRLIGENVGRGDRAIHVG